MVSRFATGTKLYDHELGFLFWNYLCWTKLVGQLATEGSFWCSLLNLAEIADGAPRLAYNRRELPQLSVSSIRSEGKGRGRPPRKNTASDRSTEENKTSDGESSFPSNQEEIIALFRRIQSSISKEGSVSTKKSSSNNAKVKQSLESVVNVLRKSPARKQVKGNIGFAFLLGIWWF